MSRDYHIIQRSLPGRKFAYFYPIDTTNNCPENWKPESGEAHKFDSEQSAVEFMKGNRKLFSLDDKAIRLHDYDGTHCPRCLRGTVRRDGTGIEGIVMTVDLSCTYCNAKWQDEFHRVSGAHMLT